MLWCDLLLLWWDLRWDRNVVVGIEIVVVEVELVLGGWLLKIAEMSGEKCHVAAVVDVVEGSGDVGAWRRGIFSVGALESAPPCPA